MTTENQAPEQVEVEVKEEVKLSPIQQKAMEQGWRPKDQFEGDPDDFIDAPEFVRRGELFAKIEHQSKDLRNLRETLEAFKAHHNKVNELAYKRALREIETQRKKAFEEGDSDKFFALEQHIDAIKQEAEAAREATKPVAEPQTPPALEAWMGKNEWYGSNRAMTALADRIGQELHAKGYTIDQALREIDAEVRKEFPEKFTVRRPPSPEGASRSGQSASKAGYKPTEDERRVARKFVQQGLFETEDAYYKELKKLAGE